MCGAVAGGPDITGVDATKEAVIQGIVLRGDEPVSPAYVRLLWPLSSSIGAPSKWALSTPMRALVCPTALLTAQTPRRRVSRPQASAM